MKLLVLKVVDTNEGGPWCKVRVPADVSLDDLHVVIQAVMGWDDSRPHRWKLGAIKAGARIDSVFTSPGASIGYVYNDQFDLKIIADSLERTDARSNDDFAVLEADTDIEGLNKRLRGAFFTVTYNPDREPTFDAWSDRDRVAAFDEAVARALLRREPGQPGVQLRERTRLHSMVEELLASTAMTTMREALARLQSEGLTRGDAIDALVTLAASFPGDVTDVQEQVNYLSAVKTMTAEAYRATFPGGPTPVVAARMQLSGARKRNQRRRKR